MVVLDLLLLGLSGRLRSSRFRKPAQCLHTQARLEPSVIRPTPPLSLPLYLEPAVDNLGPMVSNEFESFWFAVRYIFRKGWPPAETFRQRMIRRTDHPLADEQRRLCHRTRRGRGCRVRLGHRRSARRVPRPRSVLRTHRHPQPGRTEVFSLIRTSALDPSSYLDTFFDTDTDTDHEHQQQAL